MVLSGLSPFFVVLKAIFEGDKEEIKRIIKEQLQLKYHDYTI